MKTQPTLIIVLALLGIWSLDSSQAAPFSPTIEDFEDANAPFRWAPSNGVWMVGTPSGPGPGAAHSGDNCLATVLTGNYPDNMTSRAVSNRFDVPSADQNPRLRFWQWFSFSSFDYGQVQISTDDGVTWEDLSASVSPNGNPGWMRSGCSLKEYAGATGVRIGFLFYSSSSIYSPSVAPGWYIDEVQVITGNQTMPALESFEESDASVDRWITDNANGVWQIGTPTVPGPEMAHSGANCLATTLTGNYTDDTSAMAVGPRFVVPPAVKNPRVQFWQWFTFSSYDSGTVRISTDDGASWDDLGSSLSGTSSGWTAAVRDLASYAEMSVRLGFFFYSSSSIYSPSVAPGWYIDEVQIVSDGPGVPVVETHDAIEVTKVSARLKGRVNPDDQSAMAWFEYGTDPNLATFISTSPKTNIPAGTSFVDFDKVVTGLSATTKYYYRAVASNATGTTKDVIRRFHHPPTGETLAATNKTGTGATLNGNVNAIGSETTYYFEYGETPAYGTKIPAASQSVGSGYSAVPMSETITGLKPNTSYHYRIVANSVLFGPADPQGEDREFATASTEPSVVTAPPTMSTDTTARLNGTINPNGLATDYYFEYGATVGAGPKTPTMHLDAGYETQKVSADITASGAGVAARGAYQYRLVAVNSASVGGKTPGGNVDARFGAPDLFTPLALDSNKRTLKLIGQDSGSGPFQFRWRFDGDVEWHAQGATVEHLRAGEYLVEFEARAGLPPIPALPIVVENVDGVQVRTIKPPAGAAGANGSLAVLIEPEEVANNSTPEQRGQWRFSGEGDPNAAPDAAIQQWRDSGLAGLPLSPGLYLLEFKTVAGKAPIPNRGVRIAPGKATSVVAAYEDAVSVPPGAAKPQLVPFATATGTAPYEFCGEIRSDAGSGSGTVVKPRVVLTAAHVIFDDASLSYVTGLQWRFQRWRGELEPAPMTPRGSYLFSGYAAKRQQDIAAQGVGHATIDSQQEDVAAVYFRRDAGRGGYVGVLKTDSTNDWLVQTRNSILTGYPIDPAILVTEANSGRLYATAEQNNLFGALSAAAADRKRWVYSSTQVIGYPGQSGGALFVKYDDAKFYPAAIYLGGDGRAVVRAIDADVLNLLIEPAHQSSEDDSNHTDGGNVIVESRTQKGDDSPAYVTVNITPAGGKWKPSREGANKDGEASGARLSFKAGALTISFTPLTGYVAPGSFVLKELKAHEDVVIEATYAEATAPQVLTTILPDGIEGKDYAKIPVKASKAPTEISVGSSLPMGMTFMNGAIGGTPMYAGRYMVTITASNTFGTTSRQVSLIIRKPGTLTVNFDPADASRGTVPGWVNGGQKTFGVGSTVTLTATAKPGSIFKRWTGAGLPNLPSGNPKLTFEMPLLAEVTAEFMENPFTSLAGNYRGLLTGTGTKLQDYGLAQLTVTKGGVYSGSLTIAGVVNPVRGQFASDGMGAAVIKTTAGPAQLALKITLNPPHVLTGTLTVPVSNGAARVLNFIARRSLGTLPAKFTLELLPDPAHPEATYPQGTSVATVSLAKGGLVTTQVVLADGTKVTAGGYVTETASGNGTAQWTLYKDLYTRQGMLAGDILFGAPGAPAGTNLSGTVRWVRNAMPKVPRFKTGWPDGLSSPAKGYLYVAPRPAKGADPGQAVLNGLAGEVTATAVAPDDFTATMPLSALGVFKNSSAGEEKLQLTLTPSTGLFTGGFLNPPDTVRRTVTGILKQQLGEGAGFYLGPNESAAFTLDVP